MKPSRIFQAFALSALAFVALPPPVHAQTGFDCGSDGSFGPLIVDNTTGHRTISLPPNGILNCTTVNVAPGYELYFTRNARNTPAYILATGDVTIEGNIYIHGEDNVGRRGGDGGPGGFAGGQGGSNPANGCGPGAGKGGWSGAANLPPGTSIRGAGGYATSGVPTGTEGRVYGTPLLIPLVGGSGGGGADSVSPDGQFGGAGGGGALLIASNTKITFAQQNYSIWARGGNTSTGYGGGSGGAVRLVAPIITGNAKISIYGPSGGGFGRIRVDALTNTLNLIDNGDGSPNYSTFGANMVVFPANLPELRITQAAGTNIALTQTDPVFVLLPAGAPATQPIQVQVKNFNSIVPLLAVVTPEAGERQTFNFDVDNTAGGATNGSVNVQIPAGVSTRIDVWTR
jgi:hypothetical protein